MVRHTLRGNIKLVFAPTEGLWPVLADGSQLESAVLNLIINSRDVLPDGGTITIAARNRTLGQEIAAISGDLQPGDYVEISVQDTGDGIPPDILPRVFEPFFTTKEPGRGSGLGLSMVHGFASQSGGAAAIESVPGKGTKVSIFLPRDRSAPLQETENSRLTTEGTIGPRTILVLEDEADVLEMTVKMLKKLGHNAVAATRAEEALDYLRAGGKPDIMLSDVILGEEMTGPEFARLARQMLPEMKVAFMSGYTAEAFSRMPDGSTAFLLHKPFSLERLSIFIAEVLDKDPARLG
jgi:CheY-like chemotaxis protein